MAEATKSSKQQIVVMEGEAAIRDATGKSTPVAIGDELQPGQVIFTSATGHVTLMMPNGQIVEVGPDRSLLLDGDVTATQTTDPTEAVVANPANSADQILAALNQGKDLSQELEATAAGLTAGGAGDEGSSFVRLLRIAEAVDPISFDFGTANANRNFDEPSATDDQAIAAATIEPTPEAPAEPTVDTPAPVVPEPVTPAAIAEPTITANLGSSSVSEGSAAVFTLTLSAPSATPTEVTLSVLTGGSNTASPADLGNLEYFNGTVWVPVVDGKITLAANETSVQIRVPTVQDTVYEGTETFQLQATVNDQTVIGNGSIVDDGTGVVPPDQPGEPDDDRPHVLSIGDAAAVEGNALLFDIKLDHSSTTPTTLTLNLNSGSGTVGVDTGAISVSFDGGLTYIAVSGNSISVPANTLDIKVQVATIDDALLEGSETVTLTASTQYEAGNALVGTGTIIDDVGPGQPGEPGPEDTVLVSISGPSNVIEGDKTAPYTISLTQAAASDMTIQLIYSGTATDGSDYVKVVSVTIPQGATSATFDLQTLDDALLENGETIVVSLGAISGGGFEAVQASANSSVTTTISDDVGPGLPGEPGPEDTVLVSINGPASVIEGDKTAPYTISLTQAAASAMTIQLIYSGTATDGSDYVKVIRVTIPQGATSATFDLQTLNDGAIEGVENIQISLGVISGGGFEVVAVDAAHASVSTAVFDTDAAPETQNVHASGDEDLSPIAIVLSGSDSDGSVASFRLAGLPAHGVLYLDAAMTQAVSADADLVASGNQLTLYFKPDANWNGTTTFEYAAKDNEGLVDASPATATIEVCAVNDAPTANGGTALGSEDTPLVSGTVGFSWANFNVADVDSPDSSLGIKITSLPADGHLQFFNGIAWVAVALDQVVSKTDIDGGHLRFVPDHNESGIDAYGGTGVGNQQADYAQFTYQATDGNLTSANATMTIDIEPVADTPSLCLEEHPQSPPPSNPPPHDSNGGLIVLDLGLALGLGVLGLGGCPPYPTQQPSGLLGLNLGLGLGLLGTCSYAPFPGNSCSLLGLNLGLGLGLFGSSLPLPTPTHYSGGLLNLDVDLGLNLLGLGLNLGADLDVAGHNGLLGLGVLANVGAINSGTYCNWFTTHSVDLLDLNLTANVLGNGANHAPLLDAELGVALGGGQALSLFTNLEVKALEVITISLDLAATLDKLGAGVDLYWEGCKVATLDAALDGLGTFVYQLVASKDGIACLEFRPCDGNSKPCEVENLCVTQNPDNVGCEDQWIVLSKINANLNDSDGSETLRLTMNQIPVGAQLSDGVHTFIATVGMTSVDISGWNLDALKILPPADFNGQFNLQVTATATETANGDQASTSADICVTVLPVPDPAAPTASGGEVTGREDTPLISGLCNFKWSDFNVVDTDSPDHCLGIKITSLPLDGQLKYFNGLTWCDVALNQVISKDAIDHGGLIFIPDHNESGIDAYGGTGVGDQQADYARFTYQATDGHLTSANATMTIDIEPVADTPALCLEDHGPALPPPDTDAQGGLLGLNLNLGLGGTDGLLGLGVLANVGVFNTANQCHWFTSNTNNLLDLNLNANLLSNGNLLDAVLGLELGGGKALNLFTNLEVKANELYTLSVDLSSALHLGAGALIDVFWEGCKVATIDQSASGLQTLTLNLAASVTGLACLELRVAGEISVPCVLNNLCLVKAPDNIGLEDHWINLSKINAHLLDTDGSETLKLTLGNIPLGAQLSDGVHSFIASAGLTSVDVSLWDLTALKILPPADFNGHFNLSVTATATESANGDQASNCLELCVMVLPQNDAALVGGVTIGSVQEDTNFSHGFITASGQLTISDNDNQAQQYFIPQLNTIGQYGWLSLDPNGCWVYTLANFTAKVQSLDTADHKTDTFVVMTADGSVQTITINVAGLDEPNHAPLADSHLIAALEGAMTPLFIAPPVDVDCDQLTIKITGLPTTGQVMLHDGTLVSNGMTLNYHQLAGLQFMALPDSVNHTTPAGCLSYSVDDGQGHVVNADIDITILNNPLAQLLTGGDGSDHFVLLPWLDTTLKLTTGSLADLLDGLGHLLHLPQLAVNVQADADLTVLAGQYNDTIELGLSTGANLIFAGSSQADEGSSHTLAQISATAFMQDDVITHQDGRLTAAAAVSVQTSASLFDNVNSGSGDDKIYSSGGGMVAHGGAGNDVLYGNSGSDGLRGGAGNDEIAGGQGDDVLRGDSGADTFVWALGDQGTAGAPAHDVVMDFNNAKSHNAVGEVDKLDLSDLLEGESSEDLEQYMHFEKSGSDTIIHISTKGEFDPSNTTHADVAAKEDQIITLQGVDLTSAGDDQAVIHDLLEQGKLRTD